MRGKRSKQYRKLMHQFELNFNFREPYQVLVDAEMIQETARFSMDLAPALERTFHGKVKPMITQCSIRHLYQDKSADRRQKDAWIATARTFERRRCDHHELEEPLSTEECLSQVVDPKGSGTNKNRYAVASQSQQVRSNMREIPGVPLVYVKKSVMILEPMASKTADFRASLEKSKLRAGIRPRQAGVAGQETVKRKRDDEEETAEVMPAPVKKRVKTGVKGPNPLSVKRAKTAKSTHSSTEKSQNNTNPASEATVAPDNTKVTDETMAKKKRKRKHKTANGPEPSQQEE